MESILVVYYTRTGNTRRIAEGLAQRLGADLAPIEESADRHGFFGFMRSGMESVRRATPEILPMREDVRDYDLVLVGGPIWMGHIASPVRSYLAQNAGGFNSVAFFCTMGGSDATRALREMAETADRVPTGTLAIPDRDIAAGTYHPRLNDFAGALQEKLSPAHRPRPGEGELHGRL